MYFNRNILALTILFFCIVVPLITRSIYFLYISDCPNSVGWEKNERQKLGPRKVNLSGSMDPVM